MEFYSTTSVLLCGLSFTYGTLSITSKTIFPTTFAESTAYILGKAEMSVMKPVINAIIIARMSGPVYSFPVDTLTLLF